MSLVPHMIVAAGTRIGSYEIRELLGTGGMGEVYLAQDTRLGRPVALKLLLSELTNQKEHLQRFEQEAKATSALNHPNIITIHEIGRADSNHFIAAEYVEGITLRKRIASAPIETKELLDIAIQIASGLGVAHAAGIIHRDIKPENIMIRPDGYVKILDFGLAKLAEQANRFDSDSNDVTVSNIKTRSGAMVGTISYMSPEQLRGEDIDGRTDIWSFGAVLYEMITCRAPFAGPTVAAVIASILENKVLPISQRCPECPLEIQQVVSRLLQPERNARYQTIAEVADDLRRIRRDLESGVSLNDPSRSGARNSAERNSAERNSELKDAQSRLRQSESSQGGLLKRRLIDLAARHKAVSLLIVLTLAAAVGFAVSKAKSRTANAALPLQGGQIRKLTATGKSIEATISPDGKYVAYIIEDIGKHSLWIRQVGVDNNQQIVEPADVVIKGPIFSPDSNFIYYVAFEKKRILGALYRVGALGGVPTKALEDVDTPISFSPDGSQFAFVRGYPSQRETALMIANADGSQERRVATRYPPNDFGWRGGPAWSPDGKSIVCAAGYYDYKMGLVEINLRDGSAREISSDWLLIGRVVWLKNQSGLLMIAKDRLSTVSQIWHVSYPGFEARRITNDLNDYNVRSISVSSDSTSIVAVQAGYVSSILIAPNGNANQARQITSDRSDGYNGLSFAPDKRVVYASDANGNQDIWITDGSNSKQLTSGNHSNYQPSVSPDGRYIVFTSTRSGTQNIWRMDMDGGNPKQLTFLWNGVWPHCSPDGRWVIYKSFESGKRTLWKVSIDGGDPVELCDKHTGLPAVSPDGSYIACEYWDEQITSPFRLAIFSFNEGRLANQFEFPPATPLSRPDVNVIRWKDNNFITYIGNRGGVSNIWSQSIMGGDPAQLTNFTAERIFWFDWSSDGKQLALARGLIISDAVLIKAQRPDSLQ
jgi:eukaryotic-like serine/threonine-protein kinase